MSLDLFETVLERCPSIRRISLFNWGEPLLHPQITAMISRATGRGIYVQINSNFSVKRDDSFWLAIAGSGLAHLTLSIDGATQETYERFRIGGNLELILANIRSLQLAKNCLAKATPRLEWRFTVNRFNESELEEARRLAGELGVAFSTSKIETEDLPDFNFEGPESARAMKWLPRHPDHIHTPNPNRVCERLFVSPVVNPDGRVFPCCYVTDERNVFGDLREQPLAEIWNNERFRYARSLFIGQARKRPAGDIACTSCNRFRRRN